MICMYSRELVFDYKTYLSAFGSMNVKSLEDNCVVGPKSPCVCLYNICKLKPNK